MKKITLLTTVLFYVVLHGSTPSNLEDSYLNIIEINDQTLEEVYYHQISFQQPTKLVFTNLTSVDGDVYFHQNHNLVEVEFPLLKTTGEYFYFHQNTDLKVINAPNLTSVGGYLYVYGHSLLEELNICNLQEVKQIHDSIPYTYIENNNATIDGGHCLVQGTPSNLTLTNNTLSENLPTSSHIGKIEADNNLPYGELTYYLSKDDLEMDNQDFAIVNGNELVSVSTFNYEVKNEYEIKVGVRNVMGETLEKVFQIRIEDIPNENLVTIEITDRTIDSIFYHQHNFTEPTQLVFTNLTTVDQEIYFHQNNNLVEVLFPVLDKVGGIFYFHQNPSLETISAPYLSSVGNYLYVSGHSLLQRLEVCELSKIEQVDETLEPYFYIADNTETIDMGPHCFEKNLEGENSIFVYPNPSKDFIQVDSKHTLETVSLYDLSGNLVKVFKSGEGRYDVSDIAPSMYLLVSNHVNRSTKVKKIIVQ